MNMLVDETWLTPQAVVKANLLPNDPVVRELCLLEVSGDFKVFEDYLHDCLMKCAGEQMSYYRKEGCPLFYNDAQSKRPIGLNLDKDMVVGDRLMFHELVLQGRDDQAVISSSNFSYAYMRTVNGRLAASFRDVIMAGVEVCSAEFGGDFENVFSPGSQWLGCIFRGANVSKVNWERSQLMGSRFYDAKMKDVVLSEADLTGADFDRFSFTGVKFDRANLRRIHLGEVEFSNCDFSGAIVSARIAEDLSRFIDDPEYGCKGELRVM